MPSQSTENIISRLHVWVWPSPVYVWRHCGLGLGSWNSAMMVYLSSFSCLFLLSPAVQMCDGMSFGIGFRPSDISSCAYNLERKQHRMTLLVFGTRVTSSWLIDKLHYIYFS